MSEEMNNNFENKNFEHEQQNRYASYANYINEHEHTASQAEGTGFEQPSQYAQPPKKTKKKDSTMKIVALALCCALVGGGIGGVVGVKLSFNKQKENSTSTVVMKGERENTVINVKNIDTNKILTAAEVYAQNVNSTVGITTSVTTNFWGYQTTAAASGSGFVISKDGYVLTNYHVIEDASSIKVTTYAEESYDAALIGYDESNDIAVLKIEAENLSSAIIGDSDNMNVGDSVVAIGNPLGELTFSLTTGAVSALNREVTMSGGNTMKLIQTDCAINSGNSGGALFNMYGEVIGITNAKYSSSSSSEASIDNIGFAIPINDVYGIVTSIIEKGYISKPYIGISVSDVSEETQSYGLPKGAAIKRVEENSPAAAAGLQVNDIIIKAGDRDISGSGDLVEAIGEASVGDELILSVYRSGSTIEIKVTVGENIQSALAQEEQSQQNQQQSQYGYGQYGFPGFGFGYGYGG